MEGPFMKSVKFTPEPIDLQELNKVRGYGGDIAYWPRNSDDANGEPLTKYKPKSNRKGDRKTRFDNLRKMITNGDQLQLLKPVGDVSHVTIKTEFLQKMIEYDNLGAKKGKILGDGTGKTDQKYKDEFRRIFGETLPTEELGDVKFTKFAKTKIPWGGDATVTKAIVTQETPMPASSTWTDQSTVHEINICYGFTRIHAEENKKWGITKDMDHATAWKILNANKAFGGYSYTNDQSHYSVMAFDAGYSTAKNCGKKGIAYATSGGRISTSLDRIYTQYGASSLEAKTDIMVHRDKVSVKNSEGAQLASMQAGEATAAFHYGLENTAGSSNFNKKAILGMVFKSLTPQGWSSGRRMFGGSVEENDFDSFINSIINGEKDTKILKKDVKTLTKALGKQKFVKEMVKLIDGKDSKIAANIKSETIENYILQPENFSVFVAKHGDKIMRWVTNQDKKTGEFYTVKAGHLTKHQINKFVKSGVTQEVAIEYFENAPKGSVSSMLSDSKTPLVESIKDAIKLAWSTPLPEINEAIVEFLQAPALHEYITWEISTGYHKFNNGQGTADTFLGWDKSGGGYYHKIGGAHGPVISNIAKCTKLNFSDRGRQAVMIGDRLIRTGGVRVNMASKCWMSENFVPIVNTDKAFNIFEEHTKAFGDETQYFKLTEEQETWCKEFGEAYTKEYDKKYLTEEYDNFLLEGILSSIGSSLRSAGATVVRWGKKIVEAIKKLIGWIRGMFAEIVAHFSSITTNAFASSNLAAMQLFGVAQQVQLSFG